MKRSILFFLMYLSFFGSSAQIGTLSIKSIDSIARAIRSKNKLIRYIVIDTLVAKHYWIDKKSKELYVIGIEHHLSQKKGKVVNYNSYAYYFYKEELIKLDIRQSRSKKNKKGTYYFSNGKVIYKEGILTDDSYLKEPLELLGDYKSFINLKRNGG